MPTFVYWKDMISRALGGLFDQVDILPTVRRMAGKPGAELTEFFPKTLHRRDRPDVLLACQRRRVV